MNARMNECDIWARTKSSRMQIEGYWMDRMDLRKLWGRSTSRRSGFFGHLKDDPEMIGIDGLGFFDVGKGYIFILLSMGFRSLCVLRLPVCLTRTKVKPEFMDLLKRDLPPPSLTRAFVKAAPSIRIAKRKCIEATGSTSCIICPSSIVTLFELIRVPTDASSLVFYINAFNYVPITNQPLV
jgi:hypothetical protein